MSERTAHARIDYLVKILNEASEAYYGGGTELMTNYEWDALLDELQELEAKTNYILPDSPTQNVGSEKEQHGQKERHEFPALSLAKTKKVEDLQKWAGDYDIWLSWKLDGLTLVLTYDNGHLSKILTRGNGHQGSNITYLKDAITGFPVDISYTGHMVVRGEATISYSDFQSINDILEADEKFANPRNLASGTLSPASAVDEKAHIARVQERKVHFTAFTLVYFEIPMNSWGERMNYLDQLGFTTVEREKLCASTIPGAIRRWSAAVDAGAIDIPVDGLVIAYDDCAYASKGTITGHHATRAGLAFKWEDEYQITTLDHIEWSCAASTITPIAVFDPIILEGTCVSRASLYNLSELERLGIGANRRTKLKVIKSNKIIPKVVEVTMAYGPYKIPGTCPVCGAPTEIEISPSGMKSLHCTNYICPAKNIQKLSRFTSKDGFNIKGLSVETLKDFVNAGFIRDFVDIFYLYRYKKQISNMEGYGAKSCENLLASIENSKDISAVNFITALSIPGIGTDAAKKIVDSIGWDKFAEADLRIADICGIGPVRYNNLREWFSDSENKKLFTKLCDIVRIHEENSIKSSDLLNGKIFVITGSLYTFKNRDELVTYISNNGGKVASSVSNLTDYLINNDTESMSKKNLAARTLSIPILSEEDLIELIEKGRV